MKRVALLVLTLTVVADVLAVGVAGRVVRLAGSPHERRSRGPAGPTYESLNARGRASACVEVGRRHRRGALWERRRLELCVNLRYVNLESRESLWRRILFVINRQDRRYVQEKEGGGAITRSGVTSDGQSFSMALRLAKDRQASALRGVQSC